MTFDEQVAAKWCEAFLFLEEHSRLVPDEIVSLSAFGNIDGGRLRRTVGSKSANGPESDVAELLRLMDEIDVPSSDLMSQLRLVHILKNLQHHYVTSATSVVEPPLAAVVKGKRYQLVVPSRYRARGLSNAVSRDRRPTDHEVRLRRIGLAGHCWVQVPKTLNYDWKFEERLCLFRPHSAVRIGIATLGLCPLEDLSWSLSHAGENGATPPMQEFRARCQGGKRQEELGELVLEVMRRCYDNHIDIVVFPELLIDAQVLSLISKWLSEHNLRHPRIALVVAGSHHADSIREPQKFVNRLVALGSDGTEMWEQQKLRRSERSVVATELVALDTSLAGTQQWADQKVLVTEPTGFGVVVAVVDSAIGRIVTPICIDYFIEHDALRRVWPTMVIVPAMDGDTSSFEQKAGLYFSESKAMSVIANIPTRDVSMENGVRARAMHYVSGASVELQQLGDDGQLMVGEFLLS